jgi:hypothetical protein
MCNDGAMQNFLKFKNVSCVLANCKYLGGLISHVNIVPDSNICYAFFPATTVLHGQTLADRVYMLCWLTWLAQNFLKFKSVSYYFIKFQLSGWSYHVYDTVKMVPDSLTFTVLSTLLPGQTLADRVNMHYDSSDKHGIAQYFLKCKSVSWVLANCKKCVDLSHI